MGRNGQIPDVFERQSPKDWLTDSIWCVREESGMTPLFLASIMRIKLPSTGRRDCGKEQLGQERRGEELSLGQVTSEIPVHCSNGSTEYTVGNTNFGVRGRVQVGDTSLCVFRSSVAR